MTRFTFLAVATALFAAMNANNAMADTPYCQRAGSNPTAPGGGWLVWIPTSPCPQDNKCPPMGATQMLGSPMKGEECTEDGKCSDDEAECTDPVASFPEGKCHTELLEEACGPGKFFCFGGNSYDSVSVTAGDCIATEDPADASTSSANAMATSKGPVAVAIVADIISHFWSPFQNYSLLDVKWVKILLHDGSHIYLPPPPCHTAKRTQCQGGS